MERIREHLDVELRVGEATAVLVGGGGCRFLAEGHLDLLVRFGNSPNQNRLLLLQHHVAAEYIREPQLGEYGRNEGS